MRSEISLLKPRRGRLCGPNQAIHGVGSHRAFARLFLAAIGLLSIAPAQTHADWKAGVARVDITPSESIWMAGYAARTKPSEGVLQRLYAKALALKTIPAAAP
jgi:hypothetical protein